MVTIARNMVGVRMSYERRRIHTGTVQKQVDFRKVNSVISQVFYLQAYKFTTFFQVGFPNLKRLSDISWRSGNAVV